MGLLAPVLAADAGLSRALDDRYYHPTADPRMPAIDPEGAMSVPAVYACTALIAEDIGKSPMGMFEDLGDQGHRPAPSHPLHDLLHDQPNELQTALEFREMMTAFAILRGMGVAEVHDGRRGPVDSLEPLHPDLIRQERSRSTYRLVYRDPRNNFEERVLLPDEVLIVRGRLGRSVIDFGRSLILTALRRQAFDNLLFARGAKHQGVLSTPKLLGDKTRIALRQALDEYAIDGPRAGRPLLLEEGLSWQQVSITPKDLELLGLVKFTDEQIAGRLFRVPPHKIGALERSTNNNIEQQSVDYVTDTLLGWVVRWEQSVRRDLIIASGRFFAKLNLDAMMRGDPETRAKAYSLAIQWGWMTRNEVRRKEDYSPLPGLDDPLTPLNMTQGPDGQVAVSYAPLRAIGAGARTAVAGQLRLLASDAAARVVRREMAAVTKAAERHASDPAGWRADVEAFYAEHAAHVAGALHVPPHRAIRYAREQQAELLERGTAAMDDWLVDRVEALTALAMDQEEIAA